MSDMAFNNYKKLYDYYLGIILFSYQFVFWPTQKTIPLFPDSTVSCDEKALSYNSVEVGHYVKFSF